MTKNILIIHYNTPILTECLVRSVNRFVDDAHIYIFDNSTERPFSAEFDNVTLFDNTKGQMIDFNKWLEKYPNREKSNGRTNQWGSAKHCYSVEKCMELIGEPFVLLDSDVLLKKDISNLFDEKAICIGENITQPLSSIKRILPFICYINVPMCKENNVHYFDDNYMHGLRKTTDADKYDTGAGFYLSVFKRGYKEIKCNDYIIHYGHGSWNKPGVKNSLSPEEWLLYNKKYWSNDMNNKVVYTCITGGYDVLKTPKVSLGFDYVCFTDNPDIKSDVWEIRPMPKEVESLSKVKQQRYVKINPHLFLKEYDLSIWVDGNISLNGNLNDFLKRDIIKDRTSVYVPTHPSRKCIYAEAKAVISMKKDVASVVNPQMDRYKKEGYPADNGLLQSNILVRYHNKKDCITLMEAWSDEVMKGSHRDQLSFNYVSWKNDRVRIGYLDKKIYKSTWFTWNGGHSKKGGTVKSQATPTHKKLTTIKNVPTTTKKSTGRELFKKVIENKRMKSQALYNRFNGY